MRTGQDLMESWQLLNWSACTPRARSAASGRPPMLHQSAHGLRRGLGTRPSWAACPLDSRAGPAGLPAHGIVEQGAPGTPPAMRTPSNRWVPESHTLQAAECSVTDLRAAFVITNVPHGRHAAGRGKAVLATSRQQLTWQQWSIE